MCYRKIMRRCAYTTPGSFGAADLWKVAPLQSAPTCGTLSLLLNCEKTWNFSQEWKWWCLVFIYTKSTWAFSRNEHIQCQWVTEQPQDPGFLSVTGLCSLTAPPIMEDQHCIAGSPCHEGDMSSVLFNLPISPAAHFTYTRLLWRATNQTFVSGMK